MNLRTVKKDIEYLIGAFIDDCTLFCATNPKADDNTISDLLAEAVDLYNSLRDKVNAKFEGSAKQHFNEIRKELVEKTDSLYTRLSEIVSKAAAK